MVYCLFTSFRSFIRKSIKLLYTFALTTLSLFAYDEILQFRPPLFFGEPRIARDGLSAWALHLNHGSTMHGRNCAGKKVPLLHTWSSYADREQPQSGGGKFSLTEVTLVGYQNFIKGLLVGLYIPTRYLSMHCTQAWNDDYCAKGVGDIAWSLGWAYNYEETETLDFLDLTLQVGVAVPTSKMICSAVLFDVPLGYQGHTGFFGVIDGSLGVLDWLTFGAHAQCIGFSDQRECILTSCLASCPGKGSSSAPPVTALVRRNPGYVIGLYSKADHVILGLSLTLGYSFMYQGSRECYSCAGFCSEYYKNWSMHTLHTSIDYDCADYANPYAPRVALTYNNVLAGKRIIPLTLLQGTIDFTLVLKF